MLVAYLYLLVMGASQMEMVRKIKSLLLAAESGSVWSSLISTHAWDKDFVLAAYRFEDCISKLTTDCCEMKKLLMRLFV